MPQSGVTWNSAVPASALWTSIRALPTVSEVSGGIVTDVPSAVNVTPEDATAAIVIIGLEPQENVERPLTVRICVLAFRLVIDELPSATRMRQYPEAGWSDCDGAGWANGAAGRGIT